MSDHLRGLYARLRNTVVDEKIEQGKPFCPHLGATRIEREIVRVERDERFEDVHVRVYCDIGSCGALIGVENYRRTRA